MRRLLPEEVELWARVASTIRPIVPQPVVPAAGLSRLDAAKGADGAVPPPPGKPPKRIRNPERHDLAVPTRPARMLEGHTLDATWDRKLGRGMAAPDFTIDLHGASLAGAYTRLDQGLTIAAAQGARLVLLITGRPQAALDPADRAGRRGAIRAKFLDWLAQGAHATRIASIRPAHSRHGGAGAVYIVLRKAG